MRRQRSKVAKAAALTLGLALAFTNNAPAQVGPGLSSGSGEGTGTGYSSGVQRNRSGSASGVGPGPAVSPGNSLGRPLSPGPNGYRTDFTVPMGSGATTTFPDDSGLFPFSLMPTETGRTNPPDLSRIQPKEIDFARAIADPADRSITFQRMSSVAIFSGQLNLAHQGLAEAATAALLVKDPLVHDLRLIAIITTLNSLSDAHLREGKLDPTLIDLEESTSPIPRTKTNRADLIARAEVEWRRGAYLAERVVDPTYRSEMLYRVVDNQAYGSQTVVNEYPPTEADAKDPKGKDPVKAHADLILVEASGVASRIPRPVWRDRAMVSLATAAAESKQFARGVEIARLIPQPEVRTDALVKIAEIQARRGDPNGATSTYREAAIAVASIPLDDPRAVLAGVLIDNLISVGRFDDARSLIVLYSDNANRLEALGAVAESMGFRGFSDSATNWIEHDVAAEHRPGLYRRLRYGIYAAVQQNRSRDLSNRER